MVIHKIQFKIKRSTAKIFILTLVILLSPVLLPSNVSIITTLVSSLLLGLLGKRNVNVLVLTIWLSAVQNIFLGLSAYSLTVLQLQASLSANLIIVTTMAFAITKTGGVSRFQFNLFVIILALVIYSFALMVVYPVGITAFLSSLRNILYCILMFYVAYVAGKNICLEHLIKNITPVIVFAIAFGLFEYILGLEVWRTLNIERLWTLKGIGVNTFGIPSNWYSSEKIAGHQIRRMVSSFADPVNFGTFLFGAFMCAWYEKKKFLLISVLICILLCVSKGALLGILIFSVVFLWYKDRKKIGWMLGVAIAFVAGVVFINFSKQYSTGSMEFHFYGFINSLIIFINRPFGSGVGNGGVLSRLFGGTYDNSASETGMGMVLQQIGVVGLLAYMLFIIGIIKKIKCIKTSKDNEREKILGLTLVIAFFANAMFNEVALSPNSCGIYFLILGVLIRSFVQNRKIIQGKIRHLIGKAEL